MDFKNQIVLVTGASRGIGRAVAIQFAKQGASLAVHYNKNKIAAEECLSLLPGDSHIIVQADVSKAQEVEYLCMSYGSRFIRTESQDDSP